MSRLLSTKLTPDNSLTKVVAILFLPLFLLLGSCSHEPLAPLPWEIEDSVPRPEPKLPNGPEMPKPADSVEEEEDSLPPEVPMWKPGGPSAVPIPTSEMLEEASVEAPRESVTPMPDSGRAAIAAAQFSEGQLASPCQVCGEDVAHAHKPVLANLGGREFLVCGDGCIHQLRSDPRRFLSKVDPRSMMPVPPAPERKTETDVALGH